MSRIYVPRHPAGKLEVREVARVLEKHFAGPLAEVHGLFDPKPWITFDSVPAADLRQAAELYWPHGGWEVMPTWRASADGARTGTTKGTAPSSRDDGTASAPAATT